MSVFEYLVLSVFSMTLNKRRYSNEDQKILNQVWGPQVNGPLQL